MFLRRRAVRRIHVALIVGVLLVGAVPVGLDVFRITAHLDDNVIGGIDPGSAILRVGVVDPQCTNPFDGDVRLTVVETAESVTITGKVKWRPLLFLGGCNDSYDPYPVEIHLDAPLGTRRVLDGGTDPPTPVGR